MQSLTSCGITADIEIIEKITGGDNVIEVAFSDKARVKYKLVFTWVWDMRYSIENASIDRFCELRKSLQEDLIDNSIFTVENSDYIKYFQHQVSGTRSVSDLKHYILYDRVDTVLDILSAKEPTLTTV